MSSRGRPHVACVANCKSALSTPSCRHPTSSLVLENKLTNQITLITVTSMSEFTDPSVPVYMYDREGGYRMKTMGEVFFPSYQTLYIGHYLWNADDESITPASARIIQFHQIKIHAKRDYQSNHG